MKSRACKVIEHGKLFFHHHDFAIASYFLVNYMMPATLTLRNVTFTSMDMFYSIILG